MTTNSRVVFVAEHDLLRRLAALRVVHGSLDAAARAFLAGAPGVTELHLFFEARCAQACEFCEAPALRDRPALRALSIVNGYLDRWAGDLVASGAFEAVLSACDGRVPAVAVTITGYDWSRHPAREAMLGALERHPNLSKRMQGPSTALADPALARRVASLQNLAAVALTLQAADAAAHDAMVGRAGSFAEVTAAIELLRAAGAAVEISTVLTRDAVAHLPQTLHWFASRGWKTWLSAFMPDRRLPAAEPLHPSISRVRAVLTEHEVVVASTVLSIVGVPLCAVPVALHPRTFRAPESRERQPIADTVPCGRCGVRAECSGVSVSYVRAHGVGDLAPFAAGSPRVYNRRP